MNKKVVLMMIIILATGGILVFNVFAANRGYKPNEGFVPNEETAIKIAEAVWIPIYGENIYEKQPFQAIYDEKNKVWNVTGNLLDGMLGGVPEIAISKDDGRILYVNHSK